MARIEAHQIPELREPVRDPLAGPLCIMSLRRLCGERLAPIEAMDYEIHRQQCPVDTALRALQAKAQEMIADRERAARRFGWVMLGWGLVAVAGVVLALILN